MGEFPTKCHAMSNVEIYGLFDPDTYDLRYVGKTKKSNNRLTSHLREARTQTRPVHNWIKCLLSRGKVPAIEILEIVPAEHWEQAETRWIKFHRATSDLLNLADGGAMPSQTIEQRKEAGRISQKSQNANPALKKLWQAKACYARHATLMQQKGETELYERARAYMRRKAAERPDLFGNWANA